MKKAILTGTNNKIGKSLFNFLNEDFNIQTINLEIFNNKNWKKLLNENLEEYDPKVIFHTLEIRKGEINDIMTINYEFTRLLSDYSFMNNCKMIYIFNYEKNDHPTNIFQWSKHVSEILVTQNGGVAIRANENNAEDLVSITSFILENYDDLEFNSHELNLLTKRVN